MKKLLTTTLAIVAFLAFAGCASLKNNQKLENRAYGAAYAGTLATLEFLPSKRTGFEKAVADLKALEAGPMSAPRLIEIIKRLDVKELKSKEARIVITVTTVLITTEIGNTPIEQIENLRPVVVKIREGIEQGLVDSPSTQ